MDKTQYFSKKNNASFLETILTEDDIQKIKDQFTKINNGKSKRVGRRLGPVDGIKAWSNFVLNPLMSWPLSFLFQEVLRPFYDNGWPFLPRLEPEGYFKMEKFLDNKL